MIDLKSMSSTEIVDLIVSAYTELKQREQKAAGVQISYVQDTRSGAIVRRENGIPVDRPGWLYMPHLSCVSKEFQPTRTHTGASVYRDFFKEGEVLQVTTPDGVKARVKVGGKPAKIAVAGAEIVGPLTVL